MSILIRDGRVDGDDYVSLADDDAVPGDARRVIVPLERWLRERDALAAGCEAVGVHIANTVDLAAVWGSLAERPLIELDFPAFGDGRAYSQARLLRDRYGFRGEVRATGKAVVRDQMQSMARSGINGFVLRADQNAESCLAALRDFDLAYQRATDQLPIVATLRRGARHAP